MEWQFEAFGRSVPSYQDLFTNIIIVQYFLEEFPWFCIVKVIWMEPSFYCVVVNGMLVSLIIHHWNITSNNNSST